MDELKNTPILEFNANQLQAVRKAHGYEDLNKLKQDIELLKEWIQKQNHFKVKDFDPGYLERLLICNKGSIERTKQRFDKFCTFINLMPDFLQNFDIRNEFRPLLNMGYIAVLPKPTSDNYRILLSQCNGNEDDNFQLIDYYRYHVVIAHYTLYNDYCHGYVLIFDARKLTFSGVTKCNPLTINKGLILIILFSEEETAELTNIMDYWNGLPFTNDMNFEEWSSDGHIANVKFMESAATDESSRLACKFNEEYSGMPGSFKTLCVD